MRLVCLWPPPAWRACQCSVFESVKDSVPYILSGDLQPVSFDALS